MFYSVRVRQAGGSIVKMLLLQIISVPNRKCKTGVMRKQTAWSKCQRLYDV